MTDIPPYPPDHEHTPVEGQCSRCSSNRQYETVRTRYAADVSRTAVEILADWSSSPAVFDLLDEAGYSTLSERVDFAHVVADIRWLRSRLMNDDLAGTERGDYIPEYDDDEDENDDDPFWSLVGDDNDEEFFAECLVADRLAFGLHQGVGDRDKWRDQMQDILDYVAVIEERLAACRDS